MTGRRARPRRGFTFIATFPFARPLIRAVKLLPTLAALLFTTAPLFAEAAFRVETDTTAAPECEEFAAKSKALCEEWYPKINEILYGKDHPLPVPVVRLKFAPMKGVAYTTNDGIHIASEWVKKQPNDLGMVAHELTHMVQDYRGGGAGWLTEAIAEYIRDAKYEPGVRHFRFEEGKSTYKSGYNLGGTFLTWLEANKDKEIVRKLNVASKDKTYKPEMFQELCGKPLDELWTEFGESLKGQ